MPSNINDEQYNSQKAKVYLLRLNILESSPYQVLFLSPNDVCGFTVLLGGDSCVQGCR